MSVDGTLLHWYETHGRTLPWRVRRGSGERPDPYRIWLSEIMLQQTTVAAVGRYFAVFTARWPTVAALAEADDADLMAAWAGLGYYARARNLIACARTIVAEHGGQFPDDEARLRSLPGIGAYTAAAISAIAFGMHAVVVDANVERVVARLFSVDDPLPKARVTLRRLAETITPRKDAGDFAQAMMDLGATVCTPRNPHCLMCPLAGDCRARADGKPEAYPVKPLKKPRPRRFGIAYWLEARDHVFLVRRPDKGMLGGMRALPGGLWGDKAEAVPPIDARWQTVGTVEHVFTHFVLSLEIRASRLSSRPVRLPSQSGEWWPIENIEKAGLPTLYARASSLGRTLVTETA